MADANTSAGAPFVICVASAFEPAKLYVAVGSIFGNTSVSDAAAYTVIPAVAAARLGGGAARAHADAERDGEEERYGAPASALEHARELLSVVLTPGHSFPSYDVYSFIASDACWIVEDGGNESQNGVPPVLVWKYEECCASQAAIWASPVLNWFVDDPAHRTGVASRPRQTRASPPALRIDFSSSNVPCGIARS